MFARFDENLAMTLEDIKETKRYGRTHTRTHGLFFLNQTPSCRSRSAHVWPIIASISIKPYTKSHLELQREITLIELAPWKSIKLFHQKLW